MSVTEVKTAEAKINERKNDLEALTETDLPASELAEALLEVVESEK